jgi:hypothetical protein
MMAFSRCCSVAVGVHGNFFSQGRAHRPHDRNLIGPIYDLSANLQICPAQQVFVDLDFIK